MEKIQLAQCSGGGGAGLGSCEHDNRTSKKKGGVANDLTWWVNVIFWTESMNSVLCAAVLSNSTDETEVAIKRRLASSSTAKTSKHLFSRKNWCSSDVHSEQIITQVKLLQPQLTFLYVPPGLTFKNSTWRSLCVECFVRISEQTATFALYIINWLAFTTVVGSVYSAVRTDSLCKADYVSSLKC